MMILRGDERYVCNSMFIERVKKRQKRREDEKRLFKEKFFIN